MAINLDEAYQEFQKLKDENQTRNYEYYLLRQAVKGNFRWPRDWPKHIDRYTRNLCKPISERFAHYLIGKGFSYNVERPNTLEFRDAAERTEKILKRLVELSNGILQFDLGARTGTQLGRTIFKVYPKGKDGAEHACFTYCQPDYFYGIPAGDDHLGDYSVVYYSYPLDILEAKRVFGPGDYKTEAQLGRGFFYDDRPDRFTSSNLPHNTAKTRTVPVLEVWTKDDYALVVGGVVKFNGKNPFTWKRTGEGYIPFTVIENARTAGEAKGEADIAQSRELNEAYSQLLSRKYYIIKRWLNPTLVWEGAPQNYASILAQTLGGGGAIPARLGARLYFLAHSGPNPAVLELEQSIRQSILENSGMSEIALQGTVSGSVNTGPGLAAQFQPVLSTVEKKRKEWEYGLKRLFAQLLEVQEQIGDSTALGEAAVGGNKKSADEFDGDIVALSGSDIQGLREVTIEWPGILPADDVATSRLEMEKAAQGFQSIYTTLEKLGEEYPDDEISRIRMENQDPSLRGEKVAEQMRAQAPLITAQARAADLATPQAQGGEQPPVPGEPVPEFDDVTAAAEGDIGAQLRELARRKPLFSDEGDEPVIESAVGL